MRTWIIGSGADCDIVVAQPRVSGRHCRFTELADGHLVEDLGSSNGTYVNGERTAEPMRVSASDRITLGALVPMPWPPESGMPGATIIRIGRVADNEIVLDDPRVSSHHARLIVSGSCMLIEDAGSANGTFVNSLDNRATQALPLAETDTVYFGSFAVPAARLLPSRSTPRNTVPVPPPISEPLVPPQPIAAPPAIARQTMTPWTILMLVQAPIIAIAIVLFSGRQAAAPITAASWPAVVESIAATTFALALAAVWLGGSLAVWTSFVAGVLRGRVHSLQAGTLTDPVLKLALLGVLCAVQCAVLQTIVYWGSGLSGPWLSMLGVLLLTALVGLSLGLFVFSLNPAPKRAVAVLIAAFAAMTVLGGKFGALAASHPGAWIAAATPSRWAFEGLLLLENERHAAVTLPDEAGSDRADDLAEDFFPIETARMGPRADAMALGFMLIGLASAGFIASGSKPWR